MDSSGFHGFQWIPWIPVDSMDSSGFHGFHWIPLDSTGFHWIPLDSTGFHWIPLDSSPTNNSSGFQADVCGTVKHRGCERFASDTDQGLTKFYSNDK
jgi:hypothetical protein